MFKLSCLELKTFTCSKISNNIEKCWLLCIMSHDLMFSLLYVILGGISVLRPISWDTTLRHLRPGNKTTDFTILPVPFLANTPRPLNTGVYEHLLSDRKFEVPLYCIIRHCAACKKQHVIVLSPVTVQCVNTNTHYTRTLMCYWLWCRPAGEAHQGRVRLGQGRRGEEEGEDEREDGDDS